MASKSAFNIVERNQSGFVNVGDQVPLDGYKTNDIWYHRPAEEKEMRINTRVLGCGVFAILFFAGVITAVVWGADSKNRTAALDYNHDRVRISVKSTTCSLKRNCSAECTNIQVEHLLGCCSGCGLATTCSFPVNVSWYNVKAIGKTQRVWIFASLDGHFWFQSGWGAYVTNTSGYSMVTNGCFGDPGYALILVACLSELNHQDKSFEGFPSHRCNSTWGICTSTQNVLIKPLDTCNGALWYGNYNIKTWDTTKSGPEYNSAILNHPSMSLILLLALLMSKLNMFY